MPQSDNLVEKFNSRLEWKSTYQSWSIREWDSSTQKYMLADPKILCWALFCVAVFYIVVNGSLRVRENCNYTGKYAGAAHNVPLKKEAEKCVYLKLDSLMHACADFIE